jgi:chromosome segregation ATPase
LNIQRGLKDKFDNNVSLLEKLVTNEADLKHAIVKSEEELQIVKENNDFLNNKLNEAESLTGSLKKKIAAKEKEQNEWDGRLKKQIEEKDEEVRMMNKKLLDAEESLIETQTEVKKSNYA